MQPGLHPHRRATSNEDHRSFPLLLLLSSYPSIPPQPTTAANLLTYISPYFRTLSLARFWRPPQTVATEKLEEVKTGQGLRAVQQACLKAKERAAQGDNSIRGDEWM